MTKLSRMESASPQKQEAVAPGSIIHTGEAHPTVLKVWADVTTRPLEKTKCIEENLTIQFQIFKQLTEAQAEEIAQAITTIHQDNSAKAFPHLRTNAESIIAALNRDAVVIVAYNDQSGQHAPIGHAVLAKRLGNDPEREIIIAVAENFRRRGIANQMFAAVIEHAQELGVCCFVANIMSKNTAVHALLDRAKSEGKISYSIVSSGSEQEIHIKLT